MNMPIKNTDSSTLHITTNEIFNQLKQTLGEFEPTLISSYPWAEIYRLEGIESCRFLKILPPNNQPLINKLCFIGQQLKKESPTIVTANPEQGFLVYENHGGLALNRYPTDRQLRRLLARYANIQGAAYQLNELQQKIPALRLANIFNNFMDFLNPESNFTTENPGMVNASFFITLEEAQNYHLALERRRDLLTQLLKRGETLPATLNHCDLHTQNVAETHAGEMIIFDWDDAIIAPAGLSLHLVFNQCSNVFRLLDSDNAVPDELRAYEASLSTYINGLVETGYATHSELISALPATACAGAMYSLSCYAKYPLDDWAYKNDIGTLFRERLEDIVALCDLLALQNRDSVIFYANDYSQSGAPWRSAHLLNEHLKHHPNDLELQQFAAEVNMHLGRWPDAINHYQQLLAGKPNDAVVYAELGNALLKNQQPELAIRELETALTLVPDFQAAIDTINKCGYILQCRDRARIPHLAPSIQRFPHELQNNSVEIENLDLATSLYRENGVVVVENLFPTDLMRQISTLVMQKYDDYFEDREYKDNLVLGDKRRMVTLEIEGPLNNPQIYGNAMLDGLMKRLLSDDYVLGGLNAVISLPDSKDQGLHKDYSPLFRSEAIENHVTPSFAVALLTPLIDMTREHGVTSFRKGTHLIPEQMPYHFPTQEPLLKMGDAAIFDYRTAHEGLANHTDEVRPLLCIIFHRIWFRDALNYNQQKDVFIRKAELEKIPEDFKHLFKWANF